MSEPRKKIPFNELPIRVFKEIGGKGQHLAYLDGGVIRFTFIADGAIEAKRKAKAWAQAEYDKVTGKKKPTEVAE